ncbi:MAG: tetratricopeptide repeat protein [Chloroflexaceae bacterium]|nr:tetratricopeptide repeat protein [Chloroflexaceae bacterium]
MVKRGLYAFNAGQFSQAIRSWESVTPSTAALQTALAEAYFRRALQRPDHEEAIVDLQQALERKPADLRYHYHLGLTYHHMDQLDTAITLYRKVLDLEPSWDGVSWVLALALLEQDANADISALAQTYRQTASVLAPLQALLQQQPIPENTSHQASALDRLLFGLSLIQQADQRALEVLSDESRLPSKDIETIRMYYRGVAAAQQGDHQTAFECWQQVQKAGHIRTNWLSQNLALVFIQQLTAQMEANDVVAAQATAWAAAEIDYAPLNELLVTVFDTVAHDLAQKRRLAQSSSVLGTGPPESRQ